jgi:hypothetical protein
MATETVIALQQLVTRLCALLVRLTCYDFRTEFVETMGIFLADALAEADGEGTLSLIAVCLRVTGDPPSSLLHGIMSDLIDRRKGAPMSEAAQDTDGAVSIGLASASAPHSNWHSQCHPKIAPTRYLPNGSYS